MEKLNNILIKTKEASKKLAMLTEEESNKAILNIASNLIKYKDEILSANKIDIDNAIKKGLTKAMINRLELTEEKLISISNDMKKIALLKSPLGEIIETYKHNNGLIINKVRVPFGVIGVIYESRPNVSVDITCLSLKTGNACVLRGGSEALNSNIALVNIMKKSISEVTDDNVVNLIEDTDRKYVLSLIEAKEYIDLVVPRGGKTLINFVVTNSKVPFIETGAGNCHIYVDDEANIDLALKVITNAKVSRPSVCNAVETLLINKEIKDKFLPLLKQKMDEYNVLIKGCEETVKVVEVDQATEDDYYQEYNDYIVTVKVVEDINDAIKHINKYGTKHSDCIITENIIKAEDFLNQIDSACVYVNASTRFSDGGEFGFGAELGISTQKLHARGPMGLKEMTTYKYKIYGEGQIR